jgi:hypothetical protein
VNGSGEDEPDLAEVEANIDGVRSELTNVDTDPEYREFILRQYRADLQYELGRLSWLRYAVIGGAAQADPADVSAALRTALDALQEARDAQPSDSESAVYVALWLGLGWLDRYVEDHDPAALDRAIQFTEEVVAADGVETDTREETRWRLAQSLLERYGATGDAADLDRAIVEAERAAGHDWPGDGADTPNSRPAAVHTAGNARAARWNLRRNRADLDAAIAHLDQLAVPEEPGATRVPAAVVLDAGELGDLAQLHHDRAALLIAGDGHGDRGAAAAELAAARRQLGAALDRCPPDDPLRSRLLTASALLAWAAFQYSADADDLAATDRELAAALESGVGGSGTRDALVLMQQLAAAERARRGLPPLPGDQAMVTEVFARVQRQFADVVATGNPFDQPLADPSVPPRLRTLMPSAQYTKEYADRALAAWEALPADSPRRAVDARPLGASLVMAFQLGHSDLDHRRVLPLLTAALSAPFEDPHTHQAMLGMLGLTQIVAAQRGDTDQIDQALQTLARARELGGDGPARAELDILIAKARYLRANLTGDLAELSEVLAEYEKLASTADLNEAQRVALTLEHASIKAHHAYQRGDLEGLDRAAESLREGLEALSPADLRRGQVSANLAAIEAWRGMQTGGGASAAGFDRMKHAVAEAAKVTAAQPGTLGGSMLDPAAGLEFFGAAKALAEHDEAALGQHLESLRRRVDEVSQDHRQAPILRTLLAGLYLTRLEAWRTFDDADHAVEQLELARSQTDRTSLIWSQVMSWLARAYRARDDRARDDRAGSRLAGLEALRGHAWRSLLQTDATASMLAMRPVVEQANEVAAWCVVDSEPAQAAQALDACRGMALQAASRARDVPDLLDLAGQAALAGTWRALAGGTHPVELRQRVMRALLDHDASGNTGTRVGLLDPPEVTDIADALRAAGADALVYLVPQSDDQPRPLAVVVPAKGSPEILNLSILAARFNALEGYLATGLARTPDRTRAGTREMEPADDTGLSTVDPNGAAGRARRDALSALTDWAWHAAMGDILDYCARQGMTRPYRLVLVPMGAFGLVPWHAARRPGGGYVVHDAALSYAASARMFCASIRREPVPPRAESLIVGNPTGDLSHAGEEAAAICDTLRPTARYLGLRPGRAADGAGTVEAVLDWLRPSLDADRGLLHLACHADVVPNGPERSYLWLAGEDGAAQLTARRILDEVQRSPGGFRLSTVVLAACSTGVAGTAYDEAFSLATVFLTAGARSVIGSLWRVPDDATSLLMYMLHHQLVVGRLGPAQALRRAQLWMLDPGRRIPEEMPEALRLRIPAIDPDDLSGWAGFTHLGQW